MSKKKEIKLGKNAQSFSDHVCAGLEAGGKDLEDYIMQIVDDNETGEIGFLMSQVPLSEMCRIHTLESSESIVCWEDKITWYFEEGASCMIIDKRQSPSQCAVLFLGAMLTDQTIPAQNTESALND